MDIYTIIFAALAVFNLLRLRSVLGQRTGSEWPSSIPVTGILLTLTAAALGVVFFDVGRANWYLATVAPTGPARVTEGALTLVAYVIGQPIVELLGSLWDKRNRSGRPRYLTGILTAAVSCALLYVASQGKWYSALKAAVTPVTSISGLAPWVIDGDAVVFASILLAMVLCAGAALVLSFLHWKDWKAQKAGQGDGPMYLKKAKQLDGLPRPSRWPIVLGAILLAFTATTLFLNSREGVRHKTKEVVIIRGTSDFGSSNNSSGPPIEVIDGDTVRMDGMRYRLVGFDTPERGDKARCDDERRLADKATQRLRNLITTGNSQLTRMACACKPGEEGTNRCNYGRLCGVLTVGGRNVGQILIGEGLAHPYICGGTSCPPRRPWC